MVGKLVMLQMVRKSSEGLLAERLALYLAVCSVGYLVDHLGLKKVVDLGPYLDGRTAVSSVVDWVSYLVESSDAQQAVHSVDTMADDSVVK